MITYFTNELTQDRFKIESEIKSRIPRSSNCKLIPDLIYWKIILKN
jgi:hypothetical protein